MNKGLGILVCFIVITPVVVYVAWKLWVPVAQEYLEMDEEGRQRRRERDAAAAAAPAAGQA